MPKFTHPLDALRHHVTGAVERGKATPVVEQRAEVAEDVTTPLGWSRLATPRMRQAEVILFAYWAGRKGRADAEQELFWLCHYSNASVNAMLRAVDVLRGAGA